MSEKITIVLTLKDRVEFTRRWLDSLVLQNCPYRIIIGDGGSDPNVESLVTTYQDLRISYFRYPYDENLNIFIKKFISVISKVDTEYIILADNDDFFKIDQFNEYLTFLEKNADYVAARGALINFELFKQNGNSNAVAIGTHYEAFKIESQSLDLISSTKRIEDLLLGMSKFDYYANWYSIIRTRSLVDIWNKIELLNCKDMIGMEVIFHLLLTDSGKIMIGEEPFYFRQRNTSQLGDSLVLNNNFMETIVREDTIGCIKHVISNLLTPRPESEKDRIFKAISFWLDELIYSIKKVRIKQNSKLGSIHVLLRKKRIFRGFLLMSKFLYYKFMWGKSNFRMVKMNLFRNLIIDKNS
jgi:glycosyltransferase domain-containing protein